ncbi:DUF3080 family protein [Endozoicomonas sp. SCSIO W0465]|uniref:DUF3080 family protein n=1 Tax=Endozoicomonas sp. SCSIO W0465 TaxID=2918516 RepID=UPI002074CC45|nr:DUF3080 family protein [Endozoicomonas sp. SCSIO W0465]USE34440.1 DUF3080 domain-containing protein [Endozoicomonas sp. SCSIO W0465]
MIKITAKRFPALLPLAVLMLAGCSDHSSPDYFLEEYTNRLNRVTDIDPPEPDISIPALPPLRLRAYPVPDIRIKALEALDLLKCPALSQAVAYRNSSLGKQMLPSQHYFYEKTLLSLIPQCIGSLRQTNEDQEGITKLQEVLIKKQATFPTIEWNLVFANTEFSKQLNSQGRLLPADGQTGFEGTREALNYLSGLLPDQTLDAPYTLSDLESHLQQVSASRYLGELIYSAAALSQTLSNAANILELRLKKGSVCPASNPAEKERLHNVFRLFYREKIQPYLARVHQEGKIIRNDIRRLLAYLPAAPHEEVQNYLSLITQESNPAGPWYQLEQSIKHHTTTWGKFLDQCNKSPEVSDQRE